MRGVNVGELTVATGTVLTLGQVYTLEVQVDDTNGSTDMAEVRIQVVPVPDAPTGLMAHGGNAQVTLSWTVPANRGGAITSYAIKVATTSGMLSSATTATVDVSDISNGARTGQTVSYVVTKTEVTSGTDLANGTMYHFQVAAVNSVGTGAYSDPPTQATTHDVPAAPAGLTATPYERYADRPCLAGARQHGRSWSYDYEL